MEDKNQSLGKKGEDLAIQYLESRDYYILTKRFRTQRGELDIIASKETTLYGIEVKFVTELDPDFHPILKMHSRKLNLMKNVMQSFVNVNTPLSSYQQSFCLIVVDGKSKVELYSDLLI